MGNHYTIEGHDKEGNNISLSLLGKDRSGNIENDEEAKERALEVFGTMGLTGGNIEYMIRSKILPH